MTRVVTSAFSSRLLVGGWLSVVASLDTHNGANNGTERDEVTRNLNLNLDLNE